MLDTIELSYLQRHPTPPPKEITNGLFATGRRLVRAHPVGSDALLAALLLAGSSIWLAWSRFASVQATLVQVALVATIVARRSRPSTVFVVASALALVQWLLGYPLLGDAALLVALYTVAAHASRQRAWLAALVLEVGVVMAAIKWRPAGTALHSVLFLTATVVAALFAGFTAASGSRYLDWLDERARRLEIERDQQAAIAAAAERTRIARDLHDIVSHSLSVVITLADGAALVSRLDPERGAEAMSEVSEVGRHALSDMRAMLGVLRTDEGPVELTPQPGVAQLATLVERVSAAGLDADLTIDGRPFPLGAAAELTVYRIVQEALTNTLRHAAARHAWVTITYDPSAVEVEIVDDGVASPRASAGGQGGHGGHSGHGIDGIRERAALYGGVVRAGPRPAGGWSV